MNSQILAQKIIEKYNTTNVFAIAKQAGIDVIYEKWQPVTYGEFDRKNKTICINLNAPLSIERILAHELGHFFIHQMDIKLDKKDEERVVEGFANFMVAK